MKDIILDYKHIYFVDKKKLTKNKVLTKKIKINTIKPEKNTACFSEKFSKFKIEEIKIKKLKTFGKLLEKFSSTKKVIAGIRTAMLSVFNYH